MATHSSVLAWRIPGTGEPGGLPFVGLQSWTRLMGLSSSSSTLQRVTAVPPLPSPHIAALERRSKQYIIISPNLSDTTEALLIINLMFFSPSKNESFFKGGLPCFAPKDWKWIGFQQTSTLNLYL